VVRVIAGSRKGRRLTAPRGARVRPTSDRVKEALFMLVGPLDGASVLDLFAGAGGLGIEALSRGAARCVFVDADREATRAIAQNLERLDLVGATVEQRDVPASLREHRRRGDRYDLVLCDPPYDTWPRHEGALAELLPGVLAPEGMLVVETAAQVEPAVSLDPVTHRRYGSARITIFRHP
jgi:16S rRNA (guanine966-N2)-methyltransferase